MMTLSPWQRLTAVSAVAVLALAGCSSNSSSPTTNAPESNASTSSAPANPGGETKSYTDESLEKVLTGATVNGEKVKAMPPALAAQIKAGLKVALEGVQSAKVTPESCKAALTEAAKVVTADVPLALGGGARTMIILRSYPSEAEAKAMVTAIGNQAGPCATFSMEGNIAGESIKTKGTTKKLDVTTSVAKEALGIQTANEGMGSSTNYVAVFGNVAIQLTDLTGKTDAKEAADALDAIAKTVKADMNR